MLNRAISDNKCRKMRLFSHDCISIFTEQFKVFSKNNVFVPEYQNSNRAISFLNLKHKVKLKLFKATWYYEIN